MIGARLVLVVHPDVKAASVKELVDLLKAAVSLVDVKTMFADKRLPAGWEHWKKSRLDWVTNTTGLLASAFKHYRAMKARH